MEIVLSGGFYPINSGAEFNHVGINFQNAVFPPKQFDEGGKVYFQPFSNPTAAGPKENVFGRLLGNGAGPNGFLVVFVVFVGVLDGFKVKTVVLVEILVFGCLNARWKGASLG